jgi:hypothetical protein
MKIGDLVTLKHTKENEEVHVKRFMGKVGKVIDKQTTKRKISFFRVLFSGEQCYEDVGEWRIEKFLPTR